MKTLRLTMILSLFAIPVFSAPIRADLVLIDTDFESGLSSAFSGTGALTGTQGYSSFGFGSTFLRSTAGLGTSNGITLSFTGLPSHTGIDLNFFLGVIDSWDGIGDNSNGPDSFAVAVDGIIVFSHVFENSGSGTQDYSPPAGVTLARHQHLGFTNTNNFFRDSAYNLSLDSTFQNIAHTSSSLTIEWYRPGGKGTSDESWAIDNLTVTLHAVPEPSSAVSLVVGLVLFACKRRRRLVRSMKLVDPTH